MDRFNDTAFAAERKRGQHLRLDERGAIEHLHKAGFSLRAIGLQLHISHSTVWNELHRGTPDAKGTRGRRPGYKASRGQAVYDANRKRSHKPHRIESCQPFVAWIVKQVKSLNWSFDVCVGYARRAGIFQKKEMVCTKTLYNELHNRVLPLNFFDVPELLKRKRRKRIDRKHKRLKGRSISERPHLDGSEFGHWEIDTVIGRKQRESCIFTLVEKKTRYYMAFRIPRKSSISVMETMKELHTIYGNRFHQVFKTITADNGTEFTSLSQVESWGSKVYFSHPYSSWERAQNERHNGLFRRFVPKSSSINAYSDEAILSYADELNSRPRRVLGYQTPDTLFEEHLDAIYSDSI